ncbi:hypothetical protein PAMC26577_07670 [Caballeronia sordidicola]|uniref:Uncharacterized protein n=1 Tax=Caballeronia sordidicola TaxID=196367 RepID=A0A242N1D9_CABSO|nr:hypothetical protein PAMC26577_07670 [Caballeronia sordidicola]
MQIEVSYFHMWASEIVGNPHFFLATMYAERGRTSANQESVR